MIENEDYYIENGYKVLTENFLVNRGWCCGNKCRHCVFVPKHIKGSTEINEDVIKNLTESKK